MNNKTFSTILNYLGQFRIYSLFDLMLLLIATQANSQLYFGAITLHLGFITYLESKHKHKYRETIPLVIPIILFVLGLILYQRIEGILFILFSILYTKKQKEPYSYLAPILRGAQLFFLIGGITGYFDILPWLAFVVLAIRNYLGDLRDIIKDKKEKMQTLPIALGVKKNYPKAHLIALFITTGIWWTFTQTTIFVLIAIWLIQIISYNLTSR